MQQKDSSKISFEKATMNYPPTSPDSRCGLSHKGRTLDYLSRRREGGNRWINFMEKIVTMEEEGSPRFACEKKTRRMAFAMKYWITGNSCWFCRITVIEECKYVSRGTRGYAHRPADRGAKNLDAVERSFPSGTMYGRHVRNVHAFPRTHRRTHRRTHSRSLYLCINTYMYIYVCRVLHSCVFTAIIQAIRTCQHVIIHPVLRFCAPWHSWKWRFSADAWGYITRPIHATLIMAGIVIESRAFRLGLDPICCCAI